ncbi:hypothetical protein [Piscirickettsia salmonis]|uniref:hypothetical protein n=1 Tax=Piscirickettsia salmonis TaxID=1238 RepID=UPI00143DEDBE|nr:hypothetical protein [Piscirickettsia salmonis]QIX57607.1 hypothetical protein GW536_19885 [Piscirickettsia salmonis]
MLFFSSLSFSETKKAEKLDKIADSYSRCINAAIGNFKTDEQTQKGMKKLFGTLIKNIETMLELELNRKTKNSRFLNMDKKILTGYLLAKFVEPDEVFLVEKIDLKRKSVAKIRRVLLNGREVNQGFGKDSIVMLYITCSRNKPGTRLKPGGAFLIKYNKFIF